MNIGLCSDCYLPTKNGVTTLMAQTRQELERRGHRVVIFTVAYPGYVESESAAHRFPSLPFNPSIEVRLGLPRTADVDRIVARERLDLIHTHTEFSLGWAGKRAARRAGLPLIHTSHTFYPAYLHYLPLGRLLSPRLVATVYGRFLTGFDALICPSAKIQDYVASFMPALPAVVIGNGADLGRFAPERVPAAERARLRVEFGISQTGRVILYVGRIAPEKRTLALFEALRPLLRGDGNLQALFVGPGPARAALLRAIAQAGLERQVRLTGPVDWEKMVGLYAIADVFVTASLSEVHPMTLIEAATGGLPIVARRDPGFVDLVEDGYNGFLVGSDHEIAEKLAGILGDETARQTLGRNSRTLASQFTIAAHVDRLEAFYRQIVARGPEQTSCSLASVTIPNTGRPTAGPLMRS